MRLLYWPNEPLTDGGFFKSPGREMTFPQLGGRHAFEILRDTGTISALHIYPYLEQYHVLGENFDASAIRSAVEFRPDIVFIQHVTGSNISPRFWKSLRDAIPDSTIAYHDADQFSSYSKRIDRSMVGILQNCDCSIVSGFGYVHRQFGKISGKPVGYSPSPFVASMFMANDVRNVKKRFDLVMIGNHGARRRAKFLYHPGGRARAKLARSISEEYGESFALYGNGWGNLESSRGPVDYFAQEFAIQEARISLNWDLFDHVPYYFSDRLAISLAAGVPHITSNHSGYAHLLKDCPGLYLCDSVKEIQECARWLLSHTDEDLAERGLAAREWVNLNLNADVVFSRALKWVQRVRVAQVGEPCLTAVN